MNILTVNLLFSTIVFGIAAKLYLLPRLHELRARSVLLPILLLHAFRHLGLMFLAPGATYTGIPWQFAYPAALGDLLAAVLAVSAIPAVAVNARGARLLVWAFNIEGSLDLVAAIALATVTGAAVYMGPAYWIPTFWVPALLVTHYITFMVLRSSWIGDIERALGIGRRQVQRELCKGLDALSSLLYERHIGVSAARTAQPAPETLAQPRAASSHASWQLEQRLMLLSTKSAHPRLPSALVVRERLLKALDAAVEHRLTLVSASAGWGKTTLLSAWAGEHPHPIA